RRRCSPRARGTSTPARSAAGRTRPVPAGRGPESPAASCGACAAPAFATRACWHGSRPSVGEDLRRLDGPSHPYPIADRVGVLAAAQVLQSGDENIAAADVEVIVGVGA